MRETGTLERVLNRREEYAEATRQAIVAAARNLFCERGFFTTRVEDIASLARVSPATVYAVFGGKQELLRSVTEVWLRAPRVVDTGAAVAALEQPVEVLSLLARSSRLMRAEFGDIVRLLLKTAPHDSAAGEMLAAATAQYRRAMLPFAQRLEELSILKSDLTARKAVDILWFYFGYSALFTLVDDNGWSYARAEKWLVEEALRALSR
jgi:AcrR family transcriptional regulator